MNRDIKRAAELLLPRRVLTTLSAIRARNHERRLHRKWGVYDATKQAIETHGLTVLDGPFRGMRYPESSLMNHNGIPILFGTYELELHPVIEELASKPFDCIIDVGSAEGYYAVGMALRTKLVVHAFDCEPREMRYLRQMAKLNAVSDLIQTRSWCTPTTLSKLVNGRRSLVISDCEGYELELFNDRSMAALKFSDLIIEVHENVIGSNVYESLRQRFHPSHEIHAIHFDPNSVGRVPATWRKFAREVRPDEQLWLYLIAQHTSRNDHYGTDPRY